MNRYKIKGIRIDFEFESDPMESKIPINEIQVKGFKGTKDGNEVWIPPGILKRCMIESVDLNDSVEKLQKAMRTWAKESGQPYRSEESRNPPDIFAEIVKDLAERIIIKKPARMPQIEHYTGEYFTFRTDTETFTGTWGDWIRKEAKELGIIE